MYGASRVLVAVIQLPSYQSLSVLASQTVRDRHPIYIATSQRSEFLLLVSSGCATGRIGLRRLGACNHRVETGEQAH